MPNTLPASGPTPTPTPGMQHDDQIKCKILWQGNLIAVVKTFSKSTCTLYNRERVEIEKSLN
jgi:hypothetical protein